MWCLDTFISIPLDPAGLKLAPHPPLGPPPNPHWHPHLCSNPPPPPPHLPPPPVPSHPNFLVAIDKFYRTLAELKSHATAHFCPRRFRSCKELVVPGIFFPPRFLSGYETNAQLVGFSLRSGGTRGERRAPLLRPARRRQATSRSRRAPKYRSRCRWVLSGAGSRLNFHNRLP